MRKSPVYKRFREWVPQEKILVKSLDDPAQRTQGNANARQTTSSSRNDSNVTDSVGLNATQRKSIHMRERSAGDAGRIWTVFDNRAFLRNQQAKVKLFAGAHPELSSDASASAAVDGGEVSRDMSEPDGIPIVFLPGVSGQADCYFRQFVSLSPKGYRLISVSWPTKITTHEHFVSSFSRFLEEMSITKCHLFGTSVGGYLAQVFAGCDKLDRTQSLMLCNGFADTEFYESGAPCWRAFEMTPGFALQRMVLQNFPGQNKDIDAEIADSIDFMVWQIEGMGRAALASRLILNCSSPSTNVYSPGGVGERLNKGRHMTLIDSQDEIALPAAVREELYKLYPKARIAAVKTGGNFPYLSNPDEVNLHIEVHLRVLRGVGFENDDDQEEETEQATGAMRPAEANSKQEADPPPTERQVSADTKPSPPSAAAVVGKLPESNNANDDINNEDDDDDVSSSSSSSYEY